MKQVPLGFEYTDWDGSNTVLLVGGGAQVLPPKANPVQEPDLPTWSPSESEGVSIASAPSPNVAEKPILESPFEGVLGVIVGLVLMWLKGRLGQR